MENFQSVFTCKPIGVGIKYRIFLIVSHALLKSTGFLRILIWRETVKGIEGGVKWSLANATVLHAFPTQTGLLNSPFSLGAPKLKCLL